MTEDNGERRDCRGRVLRPGDWCLIVGTAVDKHDHTGFVCQFLGPLFEGEMIPGGRVIPGAWCEIYCDGGHSAINGDILLRLDDPDPEHTRRTEREEAEV